MIPEERLREAAKKAEEEFLAALPEPENCKAELSPAFERRMSRLIRRTDRPVRYWLQRCAACLALLVLLGGGILTVHAEARAVFTGWVRGIYENWFVYRYTGESDEKEEKVVYRPSWLPEGYQESKVPELSGQVVVVYESAEGKLLIFGYSWDREAMKLYIEQENAEVRSVTVWNRPAEMYMHPEADALNELVWSDEDTGTIFWLSANLGEQEMLEVAESVETVE